MSPVFITGDIILRLTTGPDIIFLKGAPGRALLGDPKGCIEIDSCQFRERRSEGVFTKEQSRKEQPFPFQSIVSQKTTCCGVGKLGVSTSDGEHGCSRRNSLAKNSPSLFKVLSRKRRPFVASERWAFSRVTDRRGIHEGTVSQGAVLPFSNYCLAKDNLLWRRNAGLFHERQRAGVFTPTASEAGGSRKRLQGDSRVGSDIPPLES